MENINKHNYIPLPEPIPITEQVWPEGTLPLVVVSTNTYNHVAYIRDCIEGILMQKTTFPVKVVIFDDYSTDGTREIVQEYESRYPNIIKGLYPKENTWRKPSRREALKPRKEMRKLAKYSALCEGDDYWIDPLKLQKQISFLEQNPEYVLIGNQASKIYESEGFSIIHPPSKLAENEFDFDAQYLMLRNPISTLTACYRNVEINYPDIYYKSIGRDRRLYMLLSEHGKCRYTNDNNGVYRIHKGGITNIFKGNYIKKIEGQKELIKNAENWNKYFNYKYNKEEALVKHKCSLKIIKLYLKHKRFSSAAKYAPYIQLEKISIPFQLVVKILKAYNFIQKRIKL